MKKIKYSEITPGSSIKSRAIPKVFIASPLRVNSPKVGIYYSVTSSIYLNCPLAGKSQIASSLSS